MPMSLSGHVISVQVTSVHNDTYFIINIPTYTSTVAILCISAKHIRSMCIYEMLQARSYRQWKEVTKIIQTKNTFTSFPKGKLF
jgi:hypothetical protein